MSRASCLPYLQINPAILLILFILIIIIVVVVVIVVVVEDEPKVGAAVVDLSAGGDAPQVLSLVQVVVGRGQVEVLIVVQAGRRAARLAT